MREPPDWLAEEARAVWIRTEPELRADADLELFALYCAAVADWSQAQQTLDRTGLVIRGVNGNLVSSPFNHLKTANAGVARGLARDLGIRVDPRLEEPATAPAKGRPRYRNQQAVERTLVGLREGGRLEPVDSATVALARTLAAAIDEIDVEEMPAQLASLARAHLAALKYLRGASEDDGDAGLADIISAMSGPLGDAPES